jgi:succinate dehydrogenase / fumarate reductase cytochrome b subunit
VHDTRPKNLNLFTIRFPLPAIVSILHRISGVILFLAVPLLILALDLSLTWGGFDLLRGWLSTIYFKFFLWLFFIPFCFHLVAGIRHLLMDVHVGTTLKGGRLGSKITIGVSIVLILLAGVWLW